MTVQIRRLQRFRREPLQLRLDQQLWEQLDQPARLGLSVEGGQLRLVSEASGKPVHIHYAGPFVRCAETELPLGAGVYAVEVRAGAIVIGARLADTDESAEAQE